MVLSMGGKDITINKNHSMVTIDGRDYVSKEIAEKLVPDDQNLTIKDNTIFIGRVIADKSNLFDQYVNDHLFTEIQNVADDSFGNSYSEVLYFNGEPYHRITYALNGKYSLLKIWAAPSNQACINRYGKIIIKADGISVYTSDELSKETSPFEKEIAINNCTLLTIEFDSDYNSDFLIYDAIVYN